MSTTKKKVATKKSVKKIVPDNNISVTAVYLNHVPQNLSIEELEKAKIELEKTNFQKKPLINC